MMQESLKIGVISDTHGYLDPQVYEIFRNVQHIIHAGDLGTLDVLISLQAIAPVTAVYGNMDGHDLRNRLRAVEQIVLAGHTVEVRHIQSANSLLPKDEPMRIGIHGHTHKPEVRWLGRTLTLNPGSASRPSQGKRPSVMVLQLQADRDPNAMIVYLD